MPGPLPRLKVGPPPPAPVASQEQHRGVYQRPAALELTPPYPGKGDAIVLPKADEDTVLVLKCPENKATCPFLDASTNDILGFLWETGCSDHSSPKARTCCCRFVDEHALHLRGGLMQCGFSAVYAPVWVAEAFALRRTSEGEPSNYACFLAASVFGTSGTASGSVGSAFRGPSSGRAAGALRPTSA